MLKRILQIIAGFILIILPFWPITENLFPPEAQVDNQTFSKYLLLCSIIIVVALGLVYFQKAQKTLAGWLFFAIGMAAIFPLHLGPPRENAELLNFSYIEQFRYGMLTVAILLFFAGSFKAAAPVKTIISKVFIVFFIVATLLNIWDNFSSFMFSTEMHKWVDSGKRADDFFTNYDYNMVWRTWARASLYAAAIWLSLLLVKQVEIRKWQFVILCIFNTIGITFCSMSLLIDAQYYYPFMVPAIALAPSYWIGLMLLCKKTDLRIKTNAQQATL